MQHESARQLKDGSGWHWVGSHTMDCRARGCEPHPTKEDAQRCQYEYELAQAAVRTSTNWSGCRECDAPTKKFYQMGGYMGAIVTLCDDHLDEEHLRKFTSPPVDRYVS